MNIKKTLLWRPIHFINYKRLYCIERIKRKKYINTGYYDKMQKTKDTVRGKCFIIGNGPSLTVKDLNKLFEYDIPCLASNRIYNLYDKTQWRPKYFFCQDDRVMKQIYNDLPYVVENSEVSFISINNYKHSGNLLDNKKVIPFFIITRPLLENTYPFAFDAASGVFEGMSVTYSMIQIAVYLGFTEIYLLGVDHTYSALNTVSGDKMSHFEGMKQIDSSNFYPANYVAMNKAFMTAKEYADNHGIKIYNATRGGMLEIFPRADFNTLINKWSK